MAPQLAWIGLGNIGRGMCKNLVEKGNLSAPLIIHNRTTKRAEDLSATLPKGKSTVALSVQDAVSKGDIIFTCLLNDQAVQDTYTTAAEGNVKGKLFVDCSTVSPETTEKLAKSMLSKGAEFVACPVFGAPAMADSGQLVCVLSGPKTAIDKVTPYCKGVVGRTEIRFDDAPYSKALVLKLIGNTVVLNMVEALSEAHVMAEKTGLGNQQLHELIETMFPGPYVAYSNRMLSGDYYNRSEPLFAVDGARKDARHARNLAENFGVQLKALEVADGHLEQVQKVKGSKGDLAGIYGACRQESGLAYGNGK